MRSIVTKNSSYYPAWSSDSSVSSASSETNDPPDVLENRLVRTTPTNAPLLAYLAQSDAEPELHSSAGGQDSDSEESMCYRCRSLLEAIIPWIKPHAGDLVSNRKRFIAKKYTDSIDIDKLEEDSSSCELCAIFHCCLHGADGFALRQVRRYNNPMFNPLSMYDENGMTDVDSYSNGHTNRRRVLMNVSAWVANRPRVTEGFVKKPMIQFEMSLRTQSLPRSSTLLLKKELPIFESIGKYRVVTVMLLYSHATRSNG